MRKEFKQTVKRAGWARCAGECECEIYVDTLEPVDYRRPRHGGVTRRCRLPVSPGRMTFDHIDPDARGGANDLENCQVVCVACDKVKTYTQDLPGVAADRRQKDAELRIKKRRGPPMAGTKASGFKRHIDGRITKR